MNSEFRIKSHDTYPLSKKILVEVPVNSHFMQANHVFIAFQEISFIEHCSYNNEGVINLEIYAHACFPLKQDVLRKLKNYL